MAAHPIPTKLFGLAVALESTGGTPETISLSTDALQLAEPGTLEGPFYIEENRRENAVSGTLSDRGVIPATPSGRWYRLSGRIPARGAGSAYSASNLPPEHGILIAAGFSSSVVTTSGSESVTYSCSDDPNTGTSDVLTVQAQTHNREYVLTYGVVESLQLQVAAGGIAYWDFSLVGIYNTDTEQALESHTGYSTNAPAKWSNASPLNIGGVTSIVARSLTADWGLRAPSRPDPTATNIAGFKVVGRQPSVQITAETLAKSTWDPEDDFNSVTKRAIDVTIGDTQYYRVKLDADNGYVASVARQDDDERIVFAVDYDCVTASGTAELDVVFD